MEATFENPSYEGSASARKYMHASDFMLFSSSCPGIFQESGFVVPVFLTPFY